MSLIDGQGSLFIDGTKIGSPGHKRKVISLSNLALVIGQDQDTFFGGYNVASSFKGSLFCYNIWNKVLSLEKIQRLAIDRRLEQGNEVTWNELKLRGSRDIKLESTPMLSMLFSC